MAFLFVEDNMKKINNDPCQNRTEHFYIESVKS